MNRKNIIIISIVLAVCLSLASVIYSLVTIYGNNDPSGNGSKNGDTSTLYSQAYVINAIVGDKITDTTLVTNNAMVKDSKNIITYNSTDNAFIVGAAGTTTVSFVVGETTYDYTINAFVVGTGTESDPFNIIRASDLIAKVSTNNSVTTFYKQQCDLDLTEFVSWTPLGKSAALPFKSNYDGNGFAIKNLKMTVTNDNLTSYVTNNVLCVSFFGFVSGTSSSQINIKNVNFDTVNIDTSVIDSNATFVGNYVAVVASRVENANFSNDANNGNVTNATITCATTITDMNNSENLIAGFVAYAKNCVISGAKVTLNFVSNYERTAVGTNAKFSKYAGIVGYINNAVLKDSTASINASIAKAPKTKVAGAVADVACDALESAGTAAVENVIITNFKATVTGITNDYSSTDLMRLSGAIDYIHGGIAKNCSASNVVIDAYKVGQSAGFANINKGGKIINCKVGAGSVIKSNISSGFITENDELIQFTNDFVDYAVENAELYGDSFISGFANRNFSTITGNSTALNKTRINANLHWNLNGSISDNSTAKVAMSGLIYNLGAGSNVSYLNITTTMNNPINAATCSAYMYSAVVDNCTFTNTINKIVNKLGTSNDLIKTNIVSGYMIYLMSSTDNDRTISNCSSTVTLIGNESVTTYDYFRQKQNIDITLINSNSSVSIN